MLADSWKVRGAPSARLDSSGMPQYALLVRLVMPARKVTGRFATLVA